MGGLQTDERYLRENKRMIERILDTLVCLLNNDFNHRVVGKRGVHVEPIIEDALLYLKARFNIHEVILVSGHKFPDIVIKTHQGNYGIEVKTTAAEKWTTMGGSIMESTKVEGLQDIFILFGMFGKDKPIFRWRRFEECAENVKITHSPRYTINMDTAPGKSIFDKVGYTYDEISRKDNKFSVFRHYLKSQASPGADVWWLSESDDVNDTFGTYVRPFDSLPDAQKLALRRELLILFPELWGSRARDKYHRASTYLVTHHGVTDHCLRDRFTAGGQLSVREVDEKIPKILEFLDNEKFMDELIADLNSLPISLLVEYWEKTEAEISHHGRIRLWYILLQSQILNKSNQKLKPFLHRVFDKYFVPN